MNEKEIVMTMVETIVDTVLDLKKQGMDDNMVKEFVMAMTRVSVNNMPIDENDQGMLN